MGMYQIFYCEMTPKNKINISKSKLLVESLVMTNNFLSLVENWCVTLFKLVSNFYISKLVNKILQN